MKRNDKVCFWSKEDNIWSEGIVDEDYTSTNVMLYDTTTAAARKEVNPRESVKDRTLYIFPFDLAGRCAPMDTVAVNGESRDVL